MSAFFERLAHRLVGDGHHLQAHQLVGQQAHQLVGQQAQAPARLAVRGRGAGQRDEVRLLRAVQPPLVHAVRPSPLQRRRQPFGDELAAHAQHGARVDVQRPGDGGVGPPRAAVAVVGLEQDAGAGQRPGGRGPAPDEAAQLGALCLGEDDAVRVRHGGASGARRRGQCPRTAHALPPANHG